MHVQIWTLAWDHLSLRDRDWLEDQYGEDFVGVIDGDASEPKGIDYTVVTAEQFISGEVKGVVTLSITHPLYPEMLAAAASVEPGYYHEEMDLTFG